jgi:hypothetical protein
MHAKFEAGRLPEVPLTTTERSCAPKLPADLARRCRVALEATVARSTRSRRRPSPTVDWCTTVFPVCPLDTGGVSLTDRVTTVRG